MTRRGERGREVGSGGELESGGGGGGGGGERGERKGEGGSRKKSDVSNWVVRTDVERRRNYLL